MNRLTEKIIMGLVCLFLLGYVGFQAYNSFYGAMQTETALEYSVSRTVSAQGVIVRSEIVIDGNYDGIENYIFENGARVTIGENVAEFYEDESSNRNLRRLHEVETEIALLEEAQDPVVSNFSTTEGINRDIKESLGYLSGISNTGKYANSADLKQKLGSLINKKQIATGVAESFNARISALTEERERLESGLSQTSTVFAKAPVSGYFCQTVDGYENNLSLKSTEAYGFGEYLAIIDGDAPTEPRDAVGKIITDQNWIFAAAASTASLEFAKPGQSVTLSFESVNQQIPATILDIMQEKDNERAVILLKCNYVSGSLLELRRASAAIHFSNHTGLRVNSTALRFVNDMRGVYILDRNNTVRFKELDPIYEESGFVLTALRQPDSQETQYVRLYDQIITKGTELYDGKVIQ